MKISLFFMVLFSTLPQYSAAQTPLSVSADFDQAVAESFKGDPLAIRAVTEKFYYMKMQQLANNDDVKWEANRKKYWESLYCSQFIVGKSPEGNEKIAKLRKVFVGMEGLKTYDADEMTKLMSNREMRRRTFKGFDGVENKDKHKFCPFSLAKDFIETRQKEFIGSDAKSLAQAEKFEYLHPKLQSVAKEMTERMSGGKPSTTKNVSDTSMVMMTQVIPIMETKARLEFLPAIEKKCPGFVEKIWLKCKDDRLYHMPNFSNLAKQFCFQDHQNEAPPACKL
ncbi:MAG: hypothetical protein JNL11_02375 [Bdellovibrionaceae bacterium]|nr:hypothetical protein [Pseudobdellovibrionaceae bacterium]